jgi:predicted RNA-binding protein YlxR (DUF448 family)
MDSIRTCIVCRQKKTKSLVNRFVVINDEVVLDIKHKINSYGYYVCDENECHTNLSKVIKKKKMKKLNVNDECFENFNDEKEVDIDQKIISLLQLAKRAGKINFGSDTVLKIMKKEKSGLIIITNDLATKSQDRIKREIDINKFDIKHWGTKDLIFTKLGKFAGIMILTDNNFVKGLNDLLKRMIKEG